MTSADEEKTTVGDGSDATGETKVIFEGKRRSGATVRDRDGGVEETKGGESDVQPARTTAVIAETAALATEPAAEAEEKEGSPAFPTERRSSDGEIKTVAPSSTVSYGLEAGDFFYGCPFPSIMEPACRMYRRSLARRKLGNVNANDSLFFLYVIRTEYCDLWEAVVTAHAGDLVVCVPQSTSLGDDITHDDAETHIMLPGKVPGEFVSLNGKTVSIVGNEVVTRRGFAESRRVRLLLTEELVDYVEDSPATGGGEAAAAASGADNTQKSKSFKEARQVKVILARAKGRAKVVKKKQVVRLLHLSRPLEGGLIAPDESDEVDQATIKGYVAVLRCYPELETVFKDLDDFIGQLNAIARVDRAALDRARPNLESIVRAQWQRSVETLIASGCMGSEEGEGQETAERHVFLLAQVAESYLMEGIHKAVYPWLVSKHEAVDSRLSEAIEMLKFHTQEDIGIKAQFQCNQADAVTAIAGLSTCTTPMAKLLALKEATKSIHAAIQRHLEVHHRDSVMELQLATDDLVLIIAFAIVQASPFSGSLLADLRYIEAFHFVSSSTSNVGFVLSNFSVALEWLVAKVGLHLVHEYSSAPALEDGVARAEHGELKVVDTRQQQLEEGQGQEGNREKEGEEGEEDMTDLMRQGEANIRAVPVVSTDVACMENVLSVESDFPDGHVATSMPEDANDGGVSGSGGGGTPTERGDDEREGDDGGEVHNTVMIFGDAGVRQSGDFVQTHAIVSDDDGLERPVRIEHVACGQQYFSVVTDNGELQTWGLAEGGRLGHGQDLDTFFPMRKPARVMALHTDVVVQVSCGAFHMLAVTQNGECWGWGDNRCNQLGLGDMNTPSVVLEPRQVMLYKAGRAGKRATQERVTSVACGSLHSLALTDGRAVYSWGRARSGRLGRVMESEQQVDYGTPKIVTTDWSFMVLEQAGKPLVPLAGTTSTAPTASGTADGGSATTASSSPPSADSPQAPVTPGGVRAIAAGWSHSIAVTMDGAVFTWGCGSQGRLGLGSHADSSFPQQVRALAANQLRMRSAAGGYAHSLFVTMTGAVFACGFDKFGQVGVRYGTSSAAEEGDVGGWGSGGGGEGGRGPNTSTSFRKEECVLVPTRVSELTGVCVTQISCGENHSAALSKDKRVFTWGLNQGNQCAHGRHVEQQERPAEVSLLAGAQQIACGAGHTLVVM